ncbi:hypothetical protein MMC18_004277 [Xylographa bjoerkii]|nr:hypothetical protein [Xylographa bjoerkii]
MAILPSTTLALIDRECYDRCMAAYYAGYGGGKGGKKAAPEAITIRRWTSSCEGQCRIGDRKANSHVPIGFSSGYHKRGVYGSDLGDLYERDFEDGLYERDLYERDLYEQDL